MASMGALISQSRSHRHQPAWRSSLLPARLALLTAPAFPRSPAEEESALLQVCGKSRSRSLVPLVTLAIKTGARYGTILTLKWDNVDFANRSLKWGKDKTAAGTGRVIQLSQRLSLL